jgi:hypothetical protein
MQAGHDHLLSDISRLQRWVVIRTVPGALPQAVAVRALGAGDKTSHQDLRLVKYIDAVENGSIGL